jgi:resolvase-like protein
MGLASCLAPWRRLSPSPCRKRDGHSAYGGLALNSVSRAMRTRVVGYVRVSSKEQVDEGVSLAAQRAKLQAYAVAMDLEVIGIEEDAGLSAKTMSGRLGVGRALALLEAGGADGILVAKLDV